jgi:catechol 2,3-dioxygenase-like lactoylglutathione lyase family enzyme
MTDATDHDSTGGTEDDPSTDDTDRARLVGLNHVALEVGDLDAALDFYQALFDFEVRGRTATGVFLDLGDQFLPLMESDWAGDTGDAEASDHAQDSRDDHRHVGLVVDDPDLVAERLADLGVDPLPTGGLDFHDPWGNRLQVVAYEEIQFTTAAHVARGMGIDDLEKTADAVAELDAKGMAPDDG